MDLRRVPFQFVSSDPATRRAELMRKFGIPSDDKMFIDPTKADPKWRKPSFGASGSAPCSPRLQHRIPCFENDGSVPIPVSHEQSSHPVKSSESFNSDLSTGNSQKAPRVRVIPIKLEDSRSVINPKSPLDVPEAHSSLGMRCNTSEFPIDNSQSRFRHSSESSLAGKSGAKPKVCNIPISVEEKTALSKDVITDGARTLSKQNNGAECGKLHNGAGCGKLHNGGSVSKSPRKSNPCSVPLKQISDVLSELETLKSSINNFNGSAQDKQYIYLDEMLTRCMLKLDDVNTMGEEKIRASRKTAVKEVQSCINILESKVQMMHPDTMEQVGDNSETMGTIEQGENSEKMESVEQVGDNSEAMGTIEQGGNSEKMESVEQDGNSGKMESVEQDGNSGKMETIEQDGNSGKMETIEQDGNSGKMETIEQDGNSGKMETIEQDGNSGKMETIEQDENSGKMETIEQDGNSGKLETIEQDVESEMKTSEQAGNSEIVETIEQAATGDPDIEEMSELLVKPENSEESKIEEIAQEPKNTETGVESCADKDKMCSEHVCSENFELEPNSVKGDGVNITGTVKESIK